MTKIKTCILHMCSKGRITQLPDSQKIFGAFTYLFAQSHPQEEVDRFVQGILHKDEYLRISNMLPHDYLPLPQSYLLDQLANMELDKAKEAYKNVKKRQYIKRKNLNDIIKEPLKSIGEYPYGSTINTQQIHASLESLKFQIPGLDPNLYSVPESHTVKIQENSTEKAEFHKYDIYLSYRDSDIMESFIKTLQQAQENNHLFILGPRATQGLNLFSIERTISSNLKFSDTHNYINLGMLLPGQIDFQTSSLKLFTSQRRPFEIKEGWNTQAPHQYISFIEAGSLIHTENIMTSSVSIASPFDEKAIVFGHAFLYPILMQKENTK